MGDECFIVLYAKRQIICNVLNLSKKCITMLGEQGEIKIEEIGLWDF